MLTSTKELNKPIVAVFVSTQVINRLKSQKSRRYFRVRKLVEANEKAKTTLYFFSYPDVDFKNFIVNGIYFDNVEKKWKERKFPFPDVLYDRVKGKSRVKIRLDYIRQRFLKMGIKRINPLDHFDKWELYQLLEKNDNLRPHLPLTRNLESTEDLKILLDHSRCIYLKACRGSRGKQVMSIKKNTRNEYEYRFYSEEIVVGEVKDLYALFRVIHAFFLGKKVLVQEAINLLTIDDCVIDVRGELQRNGKGELEVTAAPIRVGKKTSPITTRGKSFPFEVLLQKYFNYSNEQVQSLKVKLHSFLIEVYQYIEQFYGPFGEIGIDIGIDKQGKFWIIECNAKSAKVSLCSTGDNEVIRKSFLNPLEYARHIYLSVLNDG